MSALRDDQMMEVRLSANRLDRIDGPDDVLGDVVGSSSRCRIMRCVPFLARTFPAREHIWPVSDSPDDRH